MLLPSTSAVVARNHRTMLHLLRDQATTALRNSKLLAASNSRVSSTVLIDVFIVGQCKPKTTVKLGRQSKKYLFGVVITCTRENIIGVTNTTVESTKCLGQPNVEIQLIAAPPASQLAYQAPPFSESPSASS